MRKILTGWSCVLVLVLLASSCNNDDGPGVVRGYALIDTDRDDVGDMPMVGRSITLLQSDMPLLTAITDDEGAYIFEDVMPGRYIIRAEDEGDNYLDVYAGDDSNDGDPTDEVRTLRDEVTVDVEPGEDDSDNNFVERVNDRGSISGFVSEDLTLNNMADRPLADVKVLLLNEEDEELTSTRTDESGQYRFVDLPKGAYVVQVIDIKDKWPDLIPVFDGDQVADGDDNDSVINRDEQIEVTLQDQEKDDGNSFLYRTNPCAAVPLAEVLVGNWGAGSDCVTFFEDGRMTSTDQFFVLAFEGILLTEKTYSITDDGDLLIMGSNESQSVFGSRTYTVKYYDCETVVGVFSPTEDWRLVRK